MEEDNERLRREVEELRRELDQAITEQDNIRNQYQHEVETIKKRNSYLEELRERWAKEEEEARTALDKSFTQAYVKTRYEMIHYFKLGEISDWDLMEARQMCLANDAGEGLCSEAEDLSLEGGTASGENVPGDAEPERQEGQETDARQAEE